MHTHANTQTHTHTVWTKAETGVLRLLGVHKYKISQGSDDRQTRAALQTDSSTLITHAVQAHLHRDGIEQREARLRSLDQEATLPITANEIDESDCNTDSTVAAGMRADAGRAFAANRKDHVLYDPVRVNAGMRRDVDMADSGESKGLSARMLEVKALERALRKVQVCMYIYMYVHV
jgi:hypothetical protein